MRGLNLNTATLAITAFAFRYASFLLLSRSIDHHEVRCLLTDSLYLVLMGLQMLACSQQLAAVAGLLYLHDLHDTECINLWCRWITAR